MGKQFDFYCEEIRKATVVETVFGVLDEARQDVSLDRNEGTALLLVAGKRIDELKGRN